MDLPINLPAPMEQRYGVSCALNDTIAQRKLVLRQYDATALIHLEKATGHVANETK
jgi:hypothetical protein